MNYNSNIIFSSQELKKVNNFIKSTDTAVLSILFTDIVDFTKLNEKFGDIETKRIREIHDKIFDDIISREDRGIILKQIGDSFLAVFSEPTTAIKRALEFQNTISNSKELNTENFLLEVRIGVHMGQVTLENNLSSDIFGSQVNKASRISSLAKGGQILISKVIRDNIINYDEIKIKSYGKAKLKGLSDKEEIYEPYNTNVKYKGYPKKLLRKKILNILFSVIAIFIFVQIFIIKDKINKDCDIYVVDGTVWLNKYYEITKSNNKGILESTPEHLKYFSIELNRKLNQQLFDYGYKFYLSDSSNDSVLAILYQRMEESFSDSISVFMPILNEEVANLSKASGRNTLFIMLENRPRATNKNKVKYHGRMFFVYGEYWNPWPINNSSFRRRISGLEFESYDLNYLIHKIVETTRISIPKTNQQVSNVGKVISTSNNNVVIDNTLIDRLLGRKAKVAVNDIIEIKPLFQFHTPQDSDIGVNSLTSIIEYFSTLDEDSILGVNIRKNSYYLMAAQRILEIASRDESDWARHEDVFHGLRLIIRCKVTEIKNNYMVCSLIDTAITPVQNWEVVLPSPSISKLMDDK